MSSVHERGAFSRFYNIYLAGDMTAVLSRLNDRQRDLILLSMDETLTHEQIAEALGYANADVVKATLNRLRKRLRDEFGDEIGNVLREW